MACSSFSNACLCRLSKTASILLPVSCRMLVVFSVLASWVRVLSCRTVWIRASRSSRMGLISSRCLLFSFSFFVKCASCFSTSRNERMFCWSDCAKRGGSGMPCCAVAGKAIPPMIPVSTHAKVLPFMTRCPRSGCLVSERKGQHQVPVQPKPGLPAVDMKVWYEAELQLASFAKGAIASATAPAKPGAGQSRSNVPSPAHRTRDSLR
jgi:hypothetical protein